MASHLFLYYFFFLNTQFLDLKAVLNMSLIFPVASTALPSDLCDKYHIAVNKGQKENISTLSVAMQIIYSCGQHHGS